MLFALRITPAPNSLYTCTPGPREDGYPGQLVVYVLAMYMCVQRSIYTTPHEIEILREANAAEVTVRSFDIYDWIRLKI